MWLQIDLSSDNTGPWDDIFNNLGNYTITIMRHSLIKFQICTYVKYRAFGKTSSHGDHRKSKILEEDVVCNLFSPVRPLYSIGSMRKMILEMCVEFRVFCVCAAHVCVLVRVSKELEVHSWWHSKWNCKFTSSNRVSNCTNMVYYMHVRTGPDNCCSLQNGLH